MVLDIKLRRKGWDSFRGRNNTVNGRSGQPDTSRRCSEAWRRPNGMIASMLYCKSRLSCIGWKLRYTSTFSTSSKRFWALVRSPLGDKLNVLSRMLPPYPYIERLSYHTKETAFNLKLKSTPLHPTQPDP